MSRVSLIEQLYVKRKSALEFNYDNLIAPPIRSIFSQEDINELYKIATSIKYNADIEKKYELIDNIMRSRGFRKAHCGTNRVVYNFLELPTFVAKVALDKVGLKDSPAEFRNQEFFKPFCCKIFEVDPSGVIAFVERVNPITSLEEFLSVADDVFNLMITKIIGKYVVDDLGTEKFMNYGLRYNSSGYTFGPVIIDFPYAYELDGGKLICRHQIDTPFGKEICNGEIDYDKGLNNLICTKCGRTYLAQDLSKPESTMKLIFDSDGKGARIKMRAKIMSGDKVIKDSGYSSETFVTKDEWDSMRSHGSNPNHEPRRVSKNKRIKYPNARDYRRDYYSALQQQQYERLSSQGYFNDSHATVSKPVAKDYYMSSGEKYNEDCEVINYIGNTKGATRIVTLSEVNEEPMRNMTIVKSDIQEEDDEKIKFETLSEPIDNPSTVIVVAEEEEDETADEIIEEEPIDDTSVEEEEDETTDEIIEEEPVEVEEQPVIKENFIMGIDLAAKPDTEYRTVKVSDIVGNEEDQHIDSDHSYDDIKTQANNYSYINDDDNDFNHRNRGRNRNHRNKKKYNGGKKLKGFNDPNSGMNEF